MSETIHNSTVVHNIHAKCIILDFDHTIFNTTMYVQKLRDALEEIGVSGDVFDENRKALKACCSLVDIDAFVAHIPYDDKDRLHDVIHETIQHHAKDFIFSDVGDFIERHQDRYDIVILTQGDQELQSEKISHSNLPDVVQTVITQGPKQAIVAKLVGLYEEIYLIEDKAVNIDAVKTAFEEVTTYFIRRREDMPYGETQSTCECADELVEGLDFTLP